MLKKQYVKSRKVYKVTFSVPKSQYPEGVEIQSLHLVGDFNDWDRSATPMEPTSKGLYRATLELEPGSDYHFRYFLNGEQWLNEWDADGYIKNEFGEDNCVLHLPLP
jgi:hypothetical protein